MARRRSSRTEKAAIRRLFRGECGRTGTSALGRMAYIDRVYELRCLIALLDGVRAAKPHVRFTLSSGSAVRLRASGGPVNRTAHVFIEVRYTTGVIAEIWSNVEFWSHSYVQSGSAAFPGDTRARAHELDLVLLGPGLSGRPSPQDILIGVEAKHRPYAKGLLKELLGVRREMTFVSDLQPNPWAWWAPAGSPAKPPSGLVAYCHYLSIGQFSQAADFYGIKMQHLPL